MLSEKDFNIFSVPEKKLIKAFFHHVTSCKNLILQEWTFLILRDKIANIKQ